jgi:hypothetical protein
MKIILWLLTFTFLQQVAFSQDKVLLKDDFRNNKNHWQLEHDSSFLVTIKNGSLILQKFKKNYIDRGCLWYRKPIEGFNTLNNFSITLYAKFLSGGDIFDAIDLQWGNLEDNNRGGEAGGLYQLNLYYKGELALNYFDTSWTYFVKKQIKHSLDSLSFEPKKMNKYELVQLDGFVIFKINNVEIFKQLTPPIKGNSFGFQDCLKSAWEIDTILVKQLDVANKPAFLSDTVTTNSSPISPDIPKELKVYPNPFSNIFHVQFGLDKDETVNILLIDINGEVVQSRTQKLQKGFQNLMFYADIPPGIYIIKVQAADETLSSKIIKQ